MKSEKMMREAPVWKLLVQMSLPVVCVMLVNVLYNMADVFFMGRTGETMQVAAISLASPVFAIFSAFNTLLGFGACTASSIALGQGDLKSVKHYTSFALYASLFLGVLTTIIVFLFTNPLLSLLGANEQTAEHAAVYMRIFSLGAPFMVAGGSLGNTLRADGDSVNPLKATMAGTITNIVLDPIMISGLHMGIRGAALATVIGNVLSFILVVRASKSKEAFSVSPRDFSLRPEISLKVLSYGLPMAAGTMLMSFSHTFANRLLVRYGNEALAAQGVAGKAGMLISMLVMGICMGVQPAVSYSYGRRDTKRLREIIFGTGLTAVLIGVVMGGSFLIFRDAFVQSFLDDPQVIAYGRQMMLGGIVTSPLYGIYQMCAVYLQGTGKVTYATITALMQKGIVYILVLYLMHGAFGLTGLIFTSAVTDVITTAFALVFCLLRSRQIAAQSAPAETGNAAGDSAGSADPAARSLSANRKAAQIAAVKS